MRFSSAVVAFLLSPSLIACAADQENKRDVEKALSDKDSAKKPIIEDDTPKETKFNGLTVPPMTELGPNVRKHIQHDYWLVEAFSPYCHHCQALAPKWQTLYEYYYTSDPLPGSKEPPDPQTSINSFSRYYRFHFGKLDCVAFSDACDDLEVKSYPALMLFKNGERIKKASGDKSMAKLSKFLEESLDVIRPGSRPKGGVELPAVGAQGTGDVNAGEKESEGKQAMKTIPATTAKTAKTATVPRPPAPTLTATPNANGTSEELTPDTFHSRVRDTLDPWFIKFYAPWCHHCQAMQPNWEAMANQMRGKLNIGEVNCQTNAALCREANVKAYPTMKLVRGPEAVEYQGLRGVGDLMDYAEKASAAVAGVPDVDLAQFEKMEKTEEVIFVYFYDHATTSEDFMALERLPIHLLSHAKLVKTQDPALSKRFRISTWPRLMVSRDGKPSIYPKLMPQEMRNVPDLVAWMSANWLPLVPELTAANSKDLTRGKFAVLGILSRARTDEFTSAKRELKSAAIEWMEKREQTFKQERQELRDSKQLRVEEAEDRNDERALNDAKQIHVNMDYFKKRKEVAFAWVDGDFWERWVRTTFGISVRDGERVVIYDHDTHRYWALTGHSQPISPSRSSIADLLPKTLTSPPQLPPQITGSSISHLFWTLRHTFTSHPYLAILGVIGAVVGVGLWRRRRDAHVRRGVYANGYLGLDGKDGLLGVGGGGGMNGKAD